MTRRTIASLVTTTLVATVAGSALAAAPKPRLEEIPAGPDATYLVDRARGLCFFQSGQAITPVDCAKVDPALGGRAATPVTPQPAAPPKLGRGATLALEATPWAEVEIDGVEVGPTPKKLDIAPGEHALVLRRGATAARGKVKLRGGETWTALGSFPADAAPLLHVARTKPQLAARELGKGARLVLLAWPAAAYTVDGAAVGTSPCVVEAAPGVHRVAADNGKRQATTLIVLDAGDEARVDGADLEGGVDGGALDVRVLSRTPTRP